MYTFVRSFSLSWCLDTPVDIFLEFPFLTYDVYDNPTHARVPPLHIYTCTYTHVLSPFPSTSDKTLQSTFKPCANSFGKISKKSKVSSCTLGLDTVVMVESIGGYRREVTGGGRTTTRTVRIVHVGGPPVTGSNDRWKRDVTLYRGRRPSNGTSGGTWRVT